MKISVITDYWTALGITVLVVSFAHFLCDRALSLQRVGLGKTAARLAYVHRAPGLCRGLLAGRTVLFARSAPLLSLAGCIVAFCSAISLTIFPKYFSPIVDADLYHALNAPFYVGIGAAYLATFILLFHYAAARSGRLRHRD